MATDTLDKVVNDATNELEKKSEESEASPEVEIEAPAGTDDNEVGEDNEELDESQQKEAKALYQALKGPQGTAVLAALAQNAGILNKPAETKKEEATQKREIKELLKESLGEQYGFLVDKLGSAIEAIIQQEKQETEEKFQAIQLKTLEHDVVSATQRLASETKGESKKFEAKMAELSQEIPIGEMSVDRYVRVLYNVATAGRTAPSAQQKDRIRRNATDAPSRLNSGSLRSEPQDLNKKRSLNQSIEYALEQMTKR